MLFLVYVTGLSLIYSYTNRDFILLAWRDVKKTIIPYKGMMEKDVTGIYSIKITCTGN